MSKLPLKVKLGIRDFWDAPDGLLQPRLAKLKEVLGVELKCEPEWPALVAALNEYYPEQQQLVAAVAGVVGTWANAVVALLESEEWADKLMDKMAGGSLRLRLDVSKDKRVWVAWTEQQNSFVLSLPATEVIVPEGLYEQLKIATEDSFTERTEDTHAATTANDDWAEVKVEVNQLESDRPANNGSSNATSTMPLLATLPRPDVLLLRPPYCLSVHARGPASLEIQCSHSPTLEFLEAYLTKWCRSDYKVVNNPPMVNVQLHQSSFGLGQLFDRLTVESRDARYSVHTVAPSIVLALVEGTLGYEQVWCDSTSWHFKRSVAFK